MHGLFRLTNTAITKLIYLVILFFLLFHSLLSYQVLLLSFISTSNRTSSVALSCERTSLLNLALRKSFIGQVSRTSNRLSHSFSLTSGHSISDVFSPVFSSHKTLHKMVVKEPEICLFVTIVQSFSRGLICTYIVVRYLLLHDMLTKLSGECVSTTNSFFCQTPLFEHYVDSESQLQFCCNDGASSGCQLIHCTCYQCIIMLLY